MELVQQKVALCTKVYWPPKTWADVFRMISYADYVQPAQLNAWGSKDTASQIYRATGNVNNAQASSVPGEQTPDKSFYLKNIQRT